MKDIGSINNEDTSQEISSMINNGIFTTSQKTRGQNKGFTLIELMIVIAIVGILASVAFPAYQDSVRSGKRADAKGVLMNGANAMERYFTSNSSYSSAAVGSNGIPDQAPATGVANYDVTVAITGGGSGYTLTATPTTGGSMVGDGNLTLSSTGARSWGSNSCWESSCS
jgi:type IV pilus assembly protein PilE